MSKKYKRRIIDKTIDELLKSIGCIVIEGVRNCGKTTTSEHFAKTIHKLKDHDSRNEILKIDPGSLLKGETPILIDEWHNVPVIWDTVRGEVDVRRKHGQFILTGSTAPEHNVNRHSGAGRMANIKMSPMCLCESLDSSNEVDFKQLFEKNNYKIFGKKQYTPEDYAKFIIRGGWPTGLKLNEKNSIKILRSYIKNIAEIDLRNIKSKLSPERLTTLIRAISRNISTSASSDIIAQEAKISKNMIRTYLDRLTKIYLLDELEGWSTHVRSSVQLKVKPKWYFCDPSIATASLGITSSHLLNDGNAFGLFFEALALRDIRSLANSVDGSVFYLADTKNGRGNEIDIIVELWDERWAAFEIKIGSDVGIAEATRNFEWLEKIIPEKKRDKLMSKNIIIANGISYKRKDGINIISLAHLFA
ncbi:MAG: DUF4143 domain-containing protein [Mycoplasmoidaceae bacterium]|nr:MAG: DUF4143 domain-containing protein [Mycoplasmoidaceae bacterium]